MVTDAAQSESPQRGGTLSERARTLARAATSDRVTLAIVILLVVTWNSEGFLYAVGLPHGIVGIVDIGELVFGVWLALRLIRDERRPRLPLLVTIYGLWVAVGLVTTFAFAAVVTSLKAALLLPVLAYLLAAIGASERRARTVVGALMALAAFEFLVTGVQALLTSNPDAIVGTFGPSANAVTGAVVLMVSCVGIAGYLVGAQWGAAGLAAAAILPMFSAWALVKAVPVFLPVVVVVVVVAAVATRQTTRQRAWITLAVAAGPACLIIGSYALFHRDNFNVLVNFSATQTYLDTSGVAASEQAQLGSVVVANYANATVSTAPWTASTPEGEAFLIRNVGPGDYTVQMQGPDGAAAAVQPRRPFVFSAQVKAASNVLQTITPQIEWGGRGGSILGTISGVPVPSFQATAQFRRVAVAGVAPRGAVRAWTRIAVTGDPRASTGIYARQVDFRQRQSSRAVIAMVGARGSVFTTQPTAAAVRTVPGRVTQWRLAASAVSSPATMLLFGKGLGAATVAESLGVHAQSLPPDIQAASYSDFGILLVERGWTGVLITALLALAIGQAALRLARAAPRARWTTALTVAVPGVLVVVAAYGMIATQLHNRSAALTFWLIVALGLSRVTPFDATKSRPSQSDVSKQIGRLSKGKR